MLSTGISKKPLDLVGVQVHGKYAVGAGGLDDVRNELCGDGVAALRLAVLTGVAEVRMTAVIRPALARCIASIMTSSSIRLSFTGLQVDCTMNTSASA